MSQLYTPDAMVMPYRHSTLLGEEGTFEFELCVIKWHQVSVRIFSVMYDHTLFLACKSPKQTSAHKWNELSTW